MLTLKFSSTISSLLCFGFGLNARVNFGKRHLSWQFHKQHYLFYEHSKLCEIPENFQSQILFPIVKPEFTLYLVSFMPASILTFTALYLGITEIV